MFALVASAAVAQIIISPPAPDIHINGHTYTDADWQSNPTGTLSAIANDIGAITQAYPQGRFSPRVILSSDLSMYVGGTGASDANNCLINNPCATVQRPFDLLRDKYDLAGHTVTVNLAAGTYSPGLNLRGKLIGQLSPHQLLLVGNNSNPSSVTISDLRAVSSDLETGAGVPIFTGWGAELKISGVRFTASYRAIWAHVNSHIYFGLVEFGPSGTAHITSDEGSEVRAVANYSITGGAFYHYDIFSGIIIGYDPISSNFTTVTINGTQTFITFAHVQQMGQLILSSGRVGYVGSSIVGQQCIIDGLSAVNTGGSGGSYLPGSGCTITNGALYE